jgi:PBP1b-binding outer membrane lipoprotein LpoB
MTKIASALLLLSMLLAACSKKVNPSKNDEAKIVTAATAAKPAESNTTTATAEATPAKPTYIPAKKITPKSIVVNDAVAKKAVDGRLYYDLQGKRYWKNYKDGKYYLYNKNMSGNPDYKPRQ